MEKEPKWVEEFYKRAGLHSSQLLPEDREQRVYYGMLEAIGWECFKYGDAPQGGTEEQVKNYLIQHKDRIKAGTNPDFLSLLAGTFNFLLDKKRD